MSLGNDLSTIRQEQKLSLEDVHNITKIPLHILESIEKDTLLSKANENRTYQRSFIRSFAKTLKIPYKDIIAAIDATEAGIYNHDLLKSVHPEIVQEEFSIQKDHVEVSEADTPDKKTAETPAAGEQETQPKQQVPTIDSVNWADMSRKIYFSKKNSKTFLAIFFAIVIVGGIIAVVYNFDKIGGFFDSEGVFTSDSTESAASAAPQFSEPGPAESGPDSAADTLAAPELREPAARLQSPDVPAFGDTLTVVLYAAFDKLEPVRITSDFNWKTNPFWLDEGEAGYFQFRDTLLIRGQYSRMLLLFNNHVIENPRQNNYSPEYDSIILTRAMLSTGEYRNTGTGYPAGIAPPDSTRFLIRY